MRIPLALLITIVGAALLAGEATAADTKRPSVPPGLAKAGATETTLSLSWRASDDNVGVKGYRVYRNGTDAGTAKGLSYKLTGLKCNTTYIVMVSAFDAAGNTSLPAAVFAKTAACGSSAPVCATPNTVFGLLLEHEIQYGCTWPAGTFAKQAIQSVRVKVSNYKLDTWRGKKWQKVALDELAAAHGMSGAWGSKGVLLANAAGLKVQYKLGRVIRILQWHNPELFEASKSEKWALTAISWYVAASDYNKKYAIYGPTPAMNRAHADLKSADSDFFAVVSYRAWGRYRHAWQRVNGL